MLPHSRVPGRVYAEVAELGALLEALAPSLAGFVPDADVAIIYSNESKWAFQFFPPLHTAARTPDPAAYTQIFDSFYRGLVDRGAQVRVVHPEQFEADSAESFVARYPVLVVPALFIASDSTLDALRAYAEAGGHLILGMRTGYGDTEARARLEVAPGRLADAAGVSYEEYSNLDEPLSLTPAPASDFTLSPGAQATKWLDGLITHGADEVLSYDHPQFGRFPALTSRATERGRISYLGTIPNPALAQDVARWAITEPVSASWLRDATDDVTVTSGRSRDGARAWFVHNWSTTSTGSITVPDGAPITEPATGRTFTAGELLELAPCGAIVLIEE